MKKLLSIMLSIFILLWSYSYTNASYSIDYAMNNFYSKLDRSYSESEMKITKLEKINDKISSIKSKKWNKLSDKSKILINSIQSSINNKISKYKTELANQKEEISISDILSDVEEDIETLPKIQCNKLPQAHNYYECSAQAYNTWLVAYNFYLNWVLHTSIPSKNWVKQYASFQITKNSNIYVVADVNNAPGWYGWASKKIILNYEKEEVSVTLSCDKLPQINHYYECSTSSNHPSLLWYSFYLNGTKYKSIKSSSWRTERISFTIEKNSSIYVVADAQAKWGYGWESKKIYLNY
jgi:hypothetical protein